MIILAQLSGSPSEPEKLVGILAVSVIIGLAVWRGRQWLLQIRPSPDPWDETVANEVESEEAQPLCCHCISPHSPSVDFCPHCGTPVGQYTNWLPYPYLFSVGHVLRIGTSGEFKRSPLTIAGFLLLGLMEYTLFAPVYWIVFLRKIIAQRQLANPPGPSLPPC